MADDSPAIFDAGTARRILERLAALERGQNALLNGGYNQTFTRTPLTTRWARTTTSADYPTYPTSGNVVAVELGDYVASPLYPGQTATKTFTAYDPRVVVLATMESGAIPAQGEVVRITWRNGKWWVFDATANYIQIRNDSGATRSKGEALEVTGVVGTPIGSVEEILKGELRNIESVRGIVLDDIANGYVGPFALSGMVYALIDINDADHTHCYAKTADANPQSNFGGPWRIVAKPSGTGSAQPSLLLLGDSCYERKVKTTATLSAGSSASCDFYVDGSVKGSETVYFTWMENGITSIASGKEGIARWFDDEEKWCIVAAEC